MTTSTAQTRTVVTWSIVRCRQGHTQNFTLPTGTTVRFYCKDRGCYLHRMEQEQTA